jgi:hypothetical protein
MFQRNRYLCRLWLLGAAVLSIGPGLLRAGEKHHPDLVPPTLEIEVLDPNADPQGNPAVELQPRDDGRMGVEIPRTILVHKYYYTGDRTFQAQLLHGGPCIVVVNHPKTGERCYIDVQMLPGAPKVTYTPHKIEYDFGAHGICIDFGLFGFPKVVYRNGVPVSRRVGNVVQCVYTGTSELVTRTGLPEGIHDVAQGTKVVVNHAADAVHNVGTAVIKPVKQIVSMTPIGSIFSTDPAKEAERERDIGVQRAATEATKAQATIPALPFP